MTSGAGSSRQGSRGGVDGKVPGGRPAGGKAARLLVLSAALAIVIVGFAAGSIGFLFAMIESGGDQLKVVTLAVSFLFLTVGLGSVLAWQAWGAVRGRPSRPFHPRLIWPWVVLYAAAVLLGQIILTLEVAPVLFFPPLHVAATALPVIVILVAVGKALGGAASRRQVVLEFSSGAYLSTLLALALEIIAGVGLLALATAVMALQPGGMELIESLTPVLQGMVVLRDPVSLFPLFMSPMVILAVLVIMAGLVPLIEESVKTAGVGLLINQRPAISRAFLWGLASGAGFAMTEGFFNTSGALEGWVSVVLTRVGVTLLHCFTGGLIGMAWAFAFTKGRWRRAIVLFIGSLALHGLWNALALGQAFFVAGPSG